jgi:uncharacterized protein (TIGR00369 family)
VREPQHTYQPEDMVVVLMEGGRAEAHWTPSAKWGNPVGNVHGGYLGVLVDDVGGMAMYSLVGASSATVSIQIDYLEMMPLGRTYVARGEVVRAGKATAIVDVHVYDPDGTLVARGKVYFQLPRAWREQQEREKKERQA